MIYEFALEPDLVASWHNSEHCLFCKSNFGLQPRRLVSAYPKKWRTLVWKAFENSPVGNDQNAKMRLSAIIYHLSEYMIKRRSTFEEVLTWLEKVEREDQQRPFHAIIAQSNPRNNLKVIKSDELFAYDGNPLWNIPDTDVVIRNCQNLATAVEPLLKCCQRVIFIDPYFDPKKTRFTEPLEYYFNALWSNRNGVEEPRVEIHTGIDRCFKSWEKGSNRDVDDEKKACAELVRDFERIVRNIIPAGRKVEVTIWKEREKGQRLHNRYILTDIGGVLFGTGLDQAESNSSDCDDVILLPPGLYKTRVQQYTGTPPSFDEVKRFMLVGTR